MSDESGKIKTIKKNFGKKLRYAILESGQDFSNILELFNSPYNVNGEYIKVLIGSKVAKEGLNLANVRYVHIIEPGYHNSAIYQAMSRAIRSGSHDFLIEKLKADNPGMLLPVIEIKVFLHAAVFEDPSEMTSDLKFYRISEQKDIEIKKMERLIKQCAFDCQIHYKRNVRNTDRDYSAVCDYMKCKYRCLSPTPAELGMETDYSTYNILYSKSAQMSILNDALEIYKRNFALEKKDIEEYMFPSADENKENKKLLDLALAQVSNSNYFLNKNVFPLTNRYGLPVQLKVANRNKLFYLNEAASGGNDYMDWYYDENPTVVEKHSVEDYMLSTRQDDESKHLKIFLEDENTKDEDDIQEFIQNGQNIYRTIKLLETAAQIKYDPSFEGERNENMDTVDNVVEFFEKANVLYMLDRPNEKIEKYHKELALGISGKNLEEKSKRGKRITLASKSKISKLKESQEISEAESEEESEEVRRWRED